jgi:hypothetical protein
MVTIRYPVIRPPAPILATRTSTVEEAATRSSTETWGAWGAPLPPSTRSSERFTAGSALSQSRGADTTPPTTDTLGDSWRPARDSASTPGAIVCLRRPPRSTPPPHRQPALAVCNRGDRLRCARAQQTSLTPHGTQGARGPTYRHAPLFSWPPGVALPYLLRRRAYRLYRGSKPLRGARRSWRCRAKLTTAAPAGAGHARGCHRRQPQQSVERFAAFGYFGVRSPCITQSFNEGTSRAGIRRP